jgi:hypothetical protein
VIPIKAHKEIYQDFNVFVVFVFAWVQDGLMVWPQKRQKNATEELKMMAIMGDYYHDIKYIYILS